MCQYCYALSRVKTRDSANESSQEGKALISGFSYWAKMEYSLHFSHTDISRCVCLCISLSPGV